jgi:hypothetical protein
MMKEPSKKVRGSIMTRKLISSAMAVVAMLICSSAWSMNSLVGPDDINKMKTARISDAVIQLLLSEQTSSVTADFLINLKNTGADDKTLAAVILADRYKNPEKSELTVKQQEILKKAGYSDEALLKLFDGPSVKTVVDEHGNESVVYSTGGPSPAQVKNRDASQGTYNINIDRVRIP